MKIKFVALSIAFAAVSAVLSFCTKEPASVVNEAVNTQQTHVDENATDRATCDITIWVSGGGPVTVTTPTGNIVITAAMGPVTITVNSPAILTFTSNAVAGNTTVSVTGGATVVGLNLAPLQSKRVGVGANCSVVVGL